AEPGRVAHMIAIGTPFAGSKLAQYTVPRELRELSPTDRLIQRFTTVRDVDADITSIYSLLDPMILDGGALPGAHRNI
ncbi:hypothetical protein ACC691_41415, partial [Rhizobium johnstonii]|uniref:hypothetical protein n=1 Tax=Rhizobium johnstonii TaxID=3019933 RepID=UPI003F9D54E2